MCISKTKTECYKNKSLSIFNREMLVSDGQYMSEERIKAQCECPAKCICVCITQKLQHGDYNNAIKLMESIQSWKLVCVVELNAMMM